MICAGCRTAFMSVLALVSLVLPVGATDTEQRHYSIFVNGKEAGSSKMTIVQETNGSTYMRATLDVKFRQVFADYTLKLETQEWWKDARLVGMQTSSTENSKKTDVVVAMEKNQLRMKVNGQERGLKPESWTTSFWRLADARFHNNQIPVLEVDSGKEFNCELKFVGNEKQKVGGELQDCYHFRVMGGPAQGPIELWFDRYHRLVRQEFTDHGHKTIVQLVNVVR
jgi:hypothetical protein